MKNPGGDPPYRGRLAPTPSGWLHLGHAATFRTAWERARQAGGILVYRTEDIDPDRCRPEYSAGAMEDLRWWGLDWDEGPDCGGPHHPYVQSRRLAWHRECLRELVHRGVVYPSRHSRSEITACEPGRSPIDGHEIFPPGLRDDPESRRHAMRTIHGVPWRFRVPDGREIKFHDHLCGDRCYVAGRDFGDFLVWRREDLPSYELAVVADDHAMDITEVVRGEDLLLSTARQLLIYEAMGWRAPDWVHCPLVMDPATGNRMAKTHRSLALRSLRESGHPPGRRPADYL